MTKASFHGEICVTTQDLPLVVLADIEHRIQIQQKILYTLQSREDTEIRGQLWEEDNENWGFVPELMKKQQKLKRKVDVQYDKIRTLRRQWWEDNKGWAEYSQALPCKENDRPNEYDTFLRRLWGFSNQSGASDAGTSGTAISKATSAFTVIETPHGQQRMDERKISTRQLQRAVKHGIKTTE